MGLVLNITQVPQYLSLDLLLAAYRVAEIFDPVPFLLCRCTVSANKQYLIKTFLCIYTIPYLHLFAN
jgi:hypothetical protein